MEIIKDKKFGGERPLFGMKDVRLENITITDGESGIKCCQNIECEGSKFYGNTLGGMSTRASSPTVILPRRVARLSGTAAI